MPEASMNENHFSPVGKNEVRCSGKAPTVETVSVSKSRNQCAHDELWSRVGFSDARHTIADDRSDIAEFLLNHRLTLTLPAIFIGLAGTGAIRKIW
jgi:hypothetical protein